MLLVELALRVRVAIVVRQALHAEHAIHAKCKFLVVHAIPAKIVIPVKMFIKHSHRDNMEGGPLDLWAVSKPIPYSRVAYPRSGTFISNGNSLMIFASGTAYRTAAGRIEVEVKLDTVIKGYLRRYANEVNTHKTLCSDLILVTGIAAGSHTVELVLADGSSDAEDLSQVTVLELPF